MQTSAVHQTHRRLKEKFSKNERTPAGARVLLAGGDERDRTVDLLLAKQALYQLSYIPISGANSLAQTTGSVAQILSVSGKSGYVG